MTPYHSDGERHHATTATITKKKLTIEVSDDQLQAWVHRADPSHSEPIREEDIIASLEEANIIVNEHTVDRINECLALINKQDEPQPRYLIAEGCPAIEGTDATFRRHDALLEREQNWQGDAAVNYYTYHSIHLVDKDDPIGTLVPIVPGVDGVDVFGSVITPTRQPKEVELDATVRRSETEPAVVITNVPGQIDFSHGVLSIKEAFTVPSDVDFGTGNIDSPVDVQIHGTVHDGFLVKSRRAITIGGAIESASVEAQGDILIRGGILQKGRCSVRAGGDIVARFCNEADLSAGGDVKVCNEIISSRVRCEGKLFAAHGAIIGGSVYAREGIEVATLGSDANVNTKVVVGLHPKITDEAERIREDVKSKREAAERIRSVVQPLLADLKRLSPAQKEKATELMFEADTMDSDAADAENQRSTILQNARALEIPYVLASKIVHRGVTIRIGRRNIALNKPIHGPVKIEKRKLKNVTEFVAVNQLSGSLSVLPSSYVTEQPTETTVRDTGGRHGEADGSSY